MFSDILPRHTSTSAHALENTALQYYGTTQFTHLLKQSDCSGVQRFFDGQGQPLLDKDFNYPGKISDDIFLVIYKKILFTRTLSRFQFISFILQTILKTFFLFIYI